MLPLTQSLGTVPFSSMMLNSFLYIGIKMCLVAVMYSFSIPSVPLDLFAFKDKRGLTCMQHNFIHKDKDQYFIIKYLIPLWGHFIARVRKS